MISYSTGESGSGAEVEKVREATRLAQARRPDLLIDGPGKYPWYNFYRVAGLRIRGKDKLEAENEAPPIDVKSLMP